MNDASSPVRSSRTSLLVAVSALLLVTACGDDGIVDDGTGASSSGGSGTGGGGGETGAGGPGGSGAQGTGGTGNQGTGGTGAVGGGTPGGGGAGGTGGVGLPDGSHCTDDMECEGGFCLDEAGIGYPAGMCTSQCDINSPGCSGDGVCVDLGAVGICIDGCTASADCATGYMCTPAAEGDICNPECTQDSDCPDTGTCNPYSGFCDAIGVLAVEGAACVADADCESGLCFDEASTGQPGGFCSSVCDPVANTCADGNLCIDFSGGMGLPVGFCFVDCASSADCRMGYSCAENGVVDVCTAACETNADCPDTGTCNPYSGICEPLAGLGINGDACVVGADCESGFCLDEANSGQPGGICISQCDPAGSGMCPDDGACFDFSSPPDQPFGVCFDGCTGTVDCRPGYQCFEAGPIDVCNPNCESDLDCPDTGTCNPWSGMCEPLAGLGIDGDACVTGADCESGYCADEAANGFPGGMCYSLCDPAGSNTCAGDGACLDFTGAGEQPIGLCFDGCTLTAECRAGYSCFDGGNLGECASDCDDDTDCPDTGTCNTYSGSCEAIAGLAIDGDPCLQNTDCESGLCLDEITYGFVGGYCVSYCSIDNQNCPADADDGVTSPCLDLLGTAVDLGACLDGCTNFGDCRVPDYQCVASGAGNNVCF